MSKRSDLTCDDCHFRRSGLCALALESPCPTFRAAQRNAVLTPPRQPPLIPRTLAGAHA